MTNCQIPVCNDQICDSSQGDPACVEAGEICETVSNLSDAQKASIKEQINAQATEEAFNRAYHLNAGNLDPSGSSSDTQANPAPLDIPFFGAADVYPTTVDFSGLSGLVTKVVVRIFGLSHTFSSDVNIELVSPSGTSVGILTGAGVGNAVVNADMVFDDAAGAAIGCFPTADTIHSGTFKPSNCSHSDFPAPAPPQESFTVLSAFNGENPNGTWSLYVADGSGGDKGSLSGGWNMTITTGPSAGVTEPTGGVLISADTAQNSSTGGSFTKLGKIFMKEAAAGDITPGVGVTLILTAPADWRFKAGAGTISFKPAGDITAASLAVTATTLTITLTVVGSAAIDEILISDVEVQPIIGTAADGYIFNLSSNPGTASIAFVTQDVTTFGLLGKIPGEPHHLILENPLQSSIAINTGFSFPFCKVDIVDQFGTLRDTDTFTEITASLYRGAGGLGGTTTRTVLGGQTNFIDLTFDTLGPKRLRFNVTGRSIFGLMSNLITVV